MKYVAVLPWVHEPYMQECLATCKLDNLLTVDNSSNNRGVARSWNMGIDRMFAEKADWLVAFSAAVRFGSCGGLDFIDHLSETGQQNALVVEATQNVYGWHLIAFSREAIHRVGRFDENLYPGYYEDLDWSLRFQRYYDQDFREKPPPTAAWRHIVVGASDAGMGHSLRLGGITADNTELVDYFQRKWGRHPDDAYTDAYTHPFNDLDNPIGYWPPTVVDDIPGRWDTPAIPDFIDADKVEWKKAVINTRYEFVLPWPLCDWDNLPAWENERFTSLHDHLREGDVFYDVGAEQGWCSLIPALAVGPKNMVLIEPSRVQWPNIRSTWERNFDQQPLACYQGFVGDHSTDAHPHLDWPESSTGPLVTHIAYQHLFDHAEQAPQSTLDDLVKHVERPPDAINIDVEGAELAVIKGCAETLRTYHPKVWISIHPDLMEKWYDTTPEQVHNLMASFGYRGEHLATDHEQHWLFTSHARTKTST